MKTRTHKGYVMCKLYQNGIPKTVQIHRLVGLAFIPNPDNRPEINHIDGNKQNNRVDNLEWCTSSENILHAYKTGLHRGKEKTVKQYDLQGNFIREWKSATEAQRQLKIHSTSICRTCEGIYKTSGGYVWKYEEVKT